MKVLRRSGFLVVLAAAAPIHAEEKPVTSDGPNEILPASLQSLAGCTFMDGLPSNTLYNPAGVPLAHVQALNHAGTKIGYAEFALACRGEPGKKVSFRERARTPERIAAMVPPLKVGIAAEQAGRAELEKALR